MTDLVFDVTAFRLAFPAYANATTYPDATLQMNWNLATCYMDPNGNDGFLQGTCRQTALNFLTAHITYTADLISAGQTSIIVQNATIDKVAVGLTPPPVKTNWQWWLNTSPYGIQLLSLLSARSVGGWMPGGLPERSAFRKVGGIF